MAFPRNGAVQLLITILAVSSSVSQSSIIQMPSQKESIVSGRRIGAVVDLYCEAWRFTVETNDAGFWNRVPERCLDFVKDYVTGERYRTESEVVADDAVAFAKSVGFSSGGKDAWVFDVDETLLSNVPYYQEHGFGSEIFDEDSFNKWVDLAEAPALPASLRLYKELQELGFTIILLTGRSEWQRNATSTNLLRAGFSNWKRLFLRGDNDQGKPASVYKSERRKDIVDEGYIIRGNSGDQWSDLTGFAVARRSFKLPNPLYYIP